MFDAVVGLGYNGVYLLGYGKNSVPTLLCELLNNLLGWKLFKSTKFLRHPIVDLRVQSLLDQFWPSKHHSFGVLHTRPHQIQLDRIKIYQKLRTKGTSRMLFLG